MGLTRSGYVLDKADLPKSTLQRIRRDLTVTPQREGDTFRAPSFRVFRESPTSLLLPRHYAATAFGDAHEWKGGDVERRTFEFIGSLKEATRQPEAVEACMRALESMGGGILSLPTGYGKTTVALHLASRLGLKTLVVTHKEFLMEQWIERIAQFLPGARVGKIQQNVCETHDRDIVVAMIHSVCLKDYGPRAFDGFGFLILDEVHHVSAPMFSSSMFRVGCPYVLGLSATPHRKDGLTKVIEWFVGPIFFRIVRQEQRHVRVRMVSFSCPQYGHPPPVRARTGTLDMAALINSVCENRDRNDVIARRVRSLVEEGRRVMVLSDRRNHCKQLCLALADVGAALYLGGMGQEALRAAVASRVIVATYSQANEGLDIPTLDTLVLATPKPDVVQAVGRILREASGVSSGHPPLVVDILDQYAVFFAQFSKRKAFYSASGFDIEGGGASRKETAAPSFCFVKED